ncbi:uncharacterized protein E0L32_009749 [Thyridium curvatum]|uniref:Uncharacterized protein n=1 Tax=Thyridium curvatum TaxID=1093900 RepID=A0A507AV38_9PEZI|nr:uncharacterized protein E0L32_009749 [Thyridium curvatum]TPX08809.1 hypothetical protein E0L32_009749 [Thyridium curvatum]
MSASPVISAMTPPTPVVQEGNEITVTRAISSNIRIIVVGTNTTDMDQIANAAVNAIGQMAGASAANLGSRNHHEGNPRDDANSVLKAVFLPSDGPMASRMAACLNAAIVDGNLTLCNQFGDNIPNDMAGIHEGFGKIHEAILQAQGDRQAAQQAAAVKAMAKLLTWAILATSSLGCMAIAAYYMRP